jgi:hypothetical protein
MKSPPSSLNPETGKAESESGPSCTDGLDFLLRRSVAEARKRQKQKQKRKEKEESGGDNDEED